MKSTSPVWIVASLVFSYLAIPNAVRAQIVPDNTLPNASSVEAGCTNCTIEGDTTRGNNLFHSFHEFSIPTGGSALFNNAPQIENILARVTGNSVSNIDGLLRSNRTANLFLINSSGVILGANARLDIGGMFVTSRTSTIVFPNDVPSQNSAEPSRVGNGLGLITNGLSADNLTDASTLIAIDCSPTATTQANQGEFYQTGRGGIAPLPTDVLGSSDILEDLQPPASWAAATASNAPIQEAQGWQVSDQGNVILLAELPTEQRHCGH